MCGYIHCQPGHEHWQQYGGVLLVFENLVSLLEADQILTLTPVIFEVGGATFSSRRRRRKFANPLRIRCESVSAAHPSATMHPRVIEKGVYSESQQSGSCKLLTFEEDHKYAFVFPNLLLYLGEFGPKLWTCFGGCRRRPRRRKRPGCFWSYFNAKEGVMRSVVRR